MGWGGNFVVGFGGRGEVIKEWILKRRGGDWGRVKDSPVRGEDVGVVSLLPFVVTLVCEHGLSMDMVTTSGTLRCDLAFGHLVDHPRGGRQK